MSAPGSRPPSSRVPANNNPNLFESPPWLIRLSNIAGVVAVLGVLLLGTLMIRRLMTRVRVVPLPSLAQIADSTRPADGASSPAATSSFARRGEGSADSAFRSGVAALDSGRFVSAERSFALAMSRDSTASSAALGRSLAAAWLGDATVARASAEHAQRLASSLSSRERAVLAAHRLWLAGDVRRADSAWRRIVLDAPTDPTAWFGAGYVELHDGGTLDTALVALGSPAARKLRGTPWRRLSFLDAEVAFRRAATLAPGHEAALLQLARFGAMRGDRRTVDWVAWRAELVAVEPATRLALRVLAADLAPDTAAWQIARAQVAAASVGDAFAATRTLATSGGLRSRGALWRAAELLTPFAREGATHDSATVATAFAWRGMLRFAAGRPFAAFDELTRSADYDPATGLPIAAWLAWLNWETPDSVLVPLRARLEAWRPAASSPAARDEVHPHAGLEPHLREYAIGLVSDALGDTMRLAAAASAIERLGPVPDEPKLAGAMAAALRADLALARRDVPGAVAASEESIAPLRPMARDISPFTAQLHARYRRAYALQRAWANGEARSIFVSFFSPTLPELTLYRFARIRFDKTP